MTQSHRFSDQILRHSKRKATEVSPLCVLTSCDNGLKKNTKRTNETYQQNAWEMTFGIGKLWFKYDQKFQTSMGSCMALGNISHTALRECVSFDCSINRRSSRLVNFWLSKTWICRNAVWRFLSRLEPTCLSSVRLRESSLLLGILFDSCGLVARRSSADSVGFEQPGLVRIVPTYTSHYHCSSRGDEIFKYSEVDYRLKVCEKLSVVSIIRARCVCVTASFVPVCPM